LIAARVGAPRPSGRQPQRRQAGQFVLHALVEPRAVGGVLAPRPVVCPRGCIDGGRQWRRFHQHPGAAALRTLVHRAMRVVGEIPWIPQPHRQRACVQGSRGNSVLQNRVDPARKYSQHRDVHCFNPFDSFDLFAAGH